MKRIFLFLAAIMLFSVTMEMSINWMRHLQGKWKLPPDLFLFFQLMIVEFNFR